MIRLIRSWRSTIRTRILAGHGRVWTLALLAVWIVLPVPFGWRAVADARRRDEARSARLIQFRPLFVRDDSGEWAWYDLDARSADDLTALIQRTPDAAAIGVVVDDHVIEAWFIYSTVDQRRWQVEFTPMSGAERVRLDRPLRELVIRHAAPPGFPRSELGDALADRDVCLRRTLYVGWLWTAALFALAPVWLWATYRFPLMLQPWRLERRRRRLERGLCPACRYDVRQPQGTSLQTCPECGGSLAIHPIDP
jgi:hypothetical protein